MKEKVNKYDDQVAVNYAFLYMGITWRSLKTEACKYSHGTTNGSVPLQVALLPNGVFCRKCRRDRMDTYYNWHPSTFQTGQTKMSKMMRDNTWMLKKNWNTTLLNNVTGNDWLLSIITFRTTVMYVR